MRMASQVRSCNGENLRKGHWLEEEDEQLVNFVTMFGDRKWDFVAMASGLKRSGKSCRLRWLNYLRPNLKRGHITPEEEQIILQLHELWGNKWAKIARRLPGRTDNEIKNYWRSHLRKKLQAQEGNFPCKLKNIKQENFWYQMGETSSWNSNIGEDHKVGNDRINIETTARKSSLGEYELSNLGCLNSPYESRIYEWISEMSREDNERTTSGDCGDYGACFCYLMQWNVEDGGDCSSLDSFGSIWDMN